MRCPLVTTTHCGEARQRQAPPIGYRVAPSDAPLRSATDAGNHLGKTPAAPPVWTQQRNPVVSDSRISGSRVGRVAGSGSYWVPARIDLDTMLNKLDSRMLGNVTVIPGPYAVRHGPDFQYFQVDMLPSPRADQWQAGGSTSGEFKSNGQQWLGRQTVFGADSDWGYRLGYTHRTGNDYRTGGDDPEKIAASYNSRAFDLTLGKDLSDDRHLEFHLLRLDQTNVARLRLSYQWFFNGIAIPGATKPTLTVTNAGDATVGTYTVQVNNGGRVVFSEAAVHQVNQTDDSFQNVQARDKFLDAVYSIPLILGNPGASAASAEGGGEFQAAATVVRGYTGTQVFNTAGSSTEAGEEPICGVVGGASQWISFVAQESGTAFFNTDGSSYNTVIAAFTRMTNSPMLQYIDCDDNGGLDGIDSALAFPVQAGRTNFIVIDGVNRATGVLRLNYSLVTPTRLTPMGWTPAGDSKVRVSGRPNVRFTLQRSTDLKSWSSRITTNAPTTGVFDYTDPGSAALRGKYYRALLLP